MTKDLDQKVAHAMGLKSVNNCEKWGTQKNAFDWQGEPSIWSRDKELQHILQGQNWGRKAQAKINPNEKREITTYSLAKQKGKL